MGFYLTVKVVRDWSTSSLSVVSAFTMFSSLPCWPLCWTVVASLGAGRGSKATGETALWWEVSRCHCWCLCRAFSWKYVLVGCGWVANIKPAKIIASKSIGLIGTSSASKKATIIHWESGGTLTEKHHKNVSKVTGFWDCPLSNFRWGCFCLCLCKQLCRHVFYNNKCLIERYGIAYSASLKQARLRTATKVKGQNRFGKNIKIKAPGLKKQQ